MPLLSRVTAELHLGGVTVGEVAECVGKHPTTVSGWHAGRGFPPAEYFEAIAALGGGGLAARVRLLLGGDTFGPWTWPIPTERVGGSPPATALLHAVGVTMQQVADRLGVFVGTVQNWHSGVHRPTVAYFEAVSELAGSGIADRIRRVLGEPRPPTPTTSAVRVLNDAGVSVRGVAECLGVHRTAVSHWLAGRRTPTHRFFKIIEDLTDAATAQRIRALIPHKAAA